MARWACELAGRTFSPLPDGAAGWALARALPAAAWIPHVININIATKAGRAGWWPGWKAPHTGAEGAHAQTDECERGMPGRFLILTPAQSDLDKIQVKKPKEIREARAQITAESVRAPFASAKCGVNRVVAHPTSHTPRHGRRRCRPVPWCSSRG